MTATPVPNPSRLQTANLGFPRMGRGRALKFALESFWAGRSTEAELQSVAKSLRAEHWHVQRAAGIDFIPASDFSLYDQVLDMLVLLGATPARFGAGPVTLEGYFAMARNSRDQPAMEMTKWLDTNYHYLVPEWSAALPLKPDTGRLLAELAEARALGLEPRPVLIGPLTLLLLGKVVDGSELFAMGNRLLAAYMQVLGELAAANVAWVQIDEPMLVTNLSIEAQAFFRSAYKAFGGSPVSSSVKLMLTSYFGRLGENLPLALEAGTAGLHVDLVRAPEELDAVLAAAAPRQMLSLGCVDGRNIWLTDFVVARSAIAEAVTRLGAERVIVAPSCSLLHVPHDLRSEAKLAPRLKSWLCFAEEKLAEVAALAAGDKVAAAANARALADRAYASSTANVQVRADLAALSDEDFHRDSAYAERASVQRAELSLPLFPTTTIGSFPQTDEVRKHRAAFRHGHESTEQYEEFLREEIERCVRKQEEIGLDVLVHGEFERNDMVEYFAEFLEGFAFTENGWVQSYGSRCVKPPVLFGDVSRPRPMTVRWTEFAHSLSARPMKGMLTGPITILQWSFVRNDIPREQTAFQIALALRHEVRDLEAAGIRIIQVDEPALREGLPLRAENREQYLEWAVQAFRLATSAVQDTTQIHTHMCYCEFEDVLPAIAALDADVISMEAARSRMELLHSFRSHGYPNEIGPGVYDIHSPRVPSAAEMGELLRLATAVLRPEQIWVNPDCGLKTRRWPEVEEALRNMCQAAAAARLGIEN